METSLGGKILMGGVRTFKSNELLTGLSIMSVVKQTGKLEISKCLLIDPILSYKSINSYLKKTNSKVRSIEELIVKQNIVFSNFNQRFQDKLTLSINSILLMSQLSLLKVEDNYVIFTGAKFDFNEKSLGKRAQDIIAASSNLSKILSKEDASNLYLSLRIEL